MEVLAPATPTRRYWSGPAVDLGATLLQDVTPLARLSPTNTVVAHRAWISSPGVTAALHYDTFHNFFVQIVGGYTFCRHTGA